jgi:hypothetical protein
LELAEKIQERIDLIDADLRASSLSAAILPVAEGTDEVENANYSAAATTSTRRDVVAADEIQPRRLSVELSAAAVQSSKRGCCSIVCSGLGSSSLVFELLRR